jgi:Cu-Zn family superoxide dismutase
MIARIAMIFSLLLAASTANAEEIAVTVFKLDANGLGPTAGVIVARDSADGLLLTPYLRDLPPGRHAFTVNENVGCGVHYNTDGTTVPGMAAGAAIGKLPMLDVNDAGEATKPVIASNMTLDQIRGRTLVVYLGKRDTRVACGSLEHYEHTS